MPKSAGSKVSGFGLVAFFKTAKGVFSADTPAGVAKGADVSVAGFSRACISLLTGLLVISSLVHWLLVNGCKPSWMSKITDWEPKNNPVGFS